MPSQPSVLALVLVAAFLVAGCADSSFKPTGLAPKQGGGSVAQPTSQWVRGPDTPEPDYDFSKAIVRDHDHNDPDLHQAAFGLEQVGFSPVWTPGGRIVAPGGYLELAMAGSWAFISNFGPDRGFSIIDVSDPTRPEHVSDFIPADFLDIASVGAGSYFDVSVFPEGELVVLSAQAQGNGPTLSTRGGYSAAEQAGGGMFLVNTKDKHRPFMESFVQVVDPNALIAVGIHNANPFEVDGTWYVSATTVNGHTQIYQVVGKEPNRRLVQIAAIKGIHDQAVQVHPFTGEPLLYTSQGGVYIYDMSDPGKPREVSFLPDGFEMNTYHETIPSNVLIDGRHYTATGTEDLNNPTPYHLIDTTDPTAPELVGTWRIPGNLGSTSFSYRFSGHNFDFDRGRLYIGHYHAGVWIVDVSNQTNVREPMPIAFQQPHEAPLVVYRTHKQLDAPSVWRAMLHDDGYIYATDTNSGFYVLKSTGPPSPLERAPTYPTNLR